jgi:hypothetical protein
MALVPCPECKKDVSDRAAVCPQCGRPMATPPGASLGRRRLTPVIGVVVLAALGAAAFLALRPSDYERVEALRIEQDEQGTRSDAVRQRYFRLYKDHPTDAVYVYLWARCVDDASQQLALAQEGMRANPRFSWNYNLAARDLARLNRVPEAYDLAVKGAALDPASIPLAEKVDALKLMVDHHLDAQPKLAPSAGATYEGLFHGVIHAPSSSDLHAIERSRLQDHKGPVADVVQGFQVCTNHFSDACVHVYVAVDERLEPTWKHPGVDVATVKENRLVKVVGSVVANGRGENILLADAVTVEGT